MSESTLGDDQSYNSTTGTTGSTGRSYGSDRSSRTTAGTNTSSRGSSYSSASKSLKVAICLKTFFVVFTLVGGAVFALIINLLPVLLNRSKYAVPENNVIFNQDREEMERIGGYKYYQFRNKGSGLCLDDHLFPRKFQDNSLVYLYPCHEFFAITQFFRYNDKCQLIKYKEDGTLISMDKICLSVNEKGMAIEECSDDKDQQMFVYYVDYRLYNPVTKKCIDGRDRKSGDAVLAKDCVKGDPYQQWIPIEVDKYARLYGRRYQKRPPIYQSPADTNQNSDNSNMSRMVEL